jgi:hypothetical protein
LKLTKKGEVKTREAIDIFLFLGINFNAIEIFVK